MNEHSTTHRQEQVRGLREAMLNAASAHLQATVGAAKPGDMSKIIEAAFTVVVDLIDVASAGGNPTKFAEAFTTAERIYWALANDRLTKSRLLQKEIETAVRAGNAIGINRRLR